MNRLWTTTACMAGMLAFTWTAHAHFLFMRVKTVDNAPRVEVMFSENAEPDDPDLLDKVADTKVWSIEGRDKIVEASLEKKGDVLTTPAGKSTVYGLTRSYGVLDRGGESFLLNYYAKTYASPLPGDWNAVKNDERLPLEITPANKDGKIELTVTWKGKPLADAQVVVGGAGIDKLEGKTDASGKFTCEPKTDGLLAVRAKHVEEQPGKLDDKAYSAIRHWSTLTLPFTIASMKTTEHQLPPLAKGITSFGAAVVGDDLYVYGGQIGGAHHYWDEGQSNEFLRLSAKDGKWETLASGPRRTGTALVAHDGKLYRIGGFEARNKEADEADLHSMNDVERFDSATGKWDAFVAMPIARSSHDALVLGNTIYVIGGWDLQKRGEGKFHDHLVMLDLSAEKPEWKKLPVPFKRRALSVASHEGKIYVIGGMKEEGGPSTEVDIFDPVANAWSKGPSINGSGMEGFGTTSFDIDGKLTTVTKSGAIQQLSADGKTWLMAGEIKHPRFFARLLPLSQGRGILVGGADMVSGKTTDVEIIAKK